MRCVLWDEVCSVLVMYHNLLPLIPEVFVFTKSPNTLAHRLGKTICLGYLRVAILLIIGGEGRVSCCPALDCPKTTLTCRSYEYILWSKYQPHGWHRTMAILTLTPENYLKGEKKKDYNTVLCGPDYQQRQKLWEAP